MYLFRTLTYLYYKEKREYLIKAATEQSKANNRSKLLIILDMIWCSFRYGAMFSEYTDLDFIHRTSANRDTFITTFYNFRLYEKLNKREKRSTFHNKVLFLETFSALIHRQWLDITFATDEEIMEFIKHNKLAVAKNRYGDSGKEVGVISIANMTPIELRKEFNKKNYDLVEEHLTNHPSVAKLNQSSLNTLRIVTILRNNDVEVLYCGIRVGSKGANLDNISQGGKVAKVDVNTGSICTAYYTKRSSQFVNQSDNGNDIGVKIPFWDEIIKLVKKAATVEPDIKYVAWDVCITAKGPEIIEGNESFGSVIMQLFYNADQDGLKPRLLEILEQGDT